jgi:geranylgeranyl reductase family protein
MLEKLGLGGLPAATGQVCDSVMMRSPGGVMLEAIIPEKIFGGKGAVIARKALDQALILNAVRAGAELREDVTVDQLDRNGVVKVRCKGGETLEADVVLGCDGSPSVVRKALGAPPFPSRHAAFAVRAYYADCRPTRPTALCAYWFRDLLPAYGWIFPMRDGMANVGIGMRVDQLERANGKLPALLEQFVAMPEVAKELAGAQRVGKVKGHHLPYGSFATHTVHDRALLLGDAAGFINPLTGEGIEFAMESGELAAETLVDAESRGDLSHRGLSGYQVRCAKRFQVAFRLNHKLQGLFEHPWLVDHALAAARRSQRTQRDLAEVLLGEAPRISWRLMAGLAFGV